MTFERTPAVCLHKVDFSETSQVLRFFTPTRGRISCIAKGAKRKKSAFLAPFEVLAVYDLIRIEKRPGTLDILTAAERVRVFPALRRDFNRFSAACYAAQAVDEFTHDYLAVEGLYEILLETLERLDADTPIPDAVFSFEARLLRVLGFAPRLRECGLCRKTIVRSELQFSVLDGGVVCLECRAHDPRAMLVRRAATESIARFMEGEMPKKPMDRMLVVEMRKILDLVIHTHLERELKSARFMREAMTPKADPPAAPAP